MESYTPLLEKTRAPQPSLQKFAVISVFSKLRSAPSHLGPDSEPGREAISFCLLSASPAVADQSVRELCRLVADSKMELSRGLMELQSALEGSDSKLAGLFVKGIGFLVRLGFHRSGGSWRFSAESHPFTKVLLCRAEVKDELVQQVLLFMVQNERVEMLKVCEFLRSFLSYSVLRIPLSDFTTASFVRHLLTSMASICCSLPHESIPVFKLLMGCIKYYPFGKADDFRNLMCIVERVVDAYAVVLKHFVGKQSRISETQLCGVELLETVLALNTVPLEIPGWITPIIEFVGRVLVLFIDLGLYYLPELSSTTLSLSIILTQSELEHEQMSMLKLLFHLLSWKCDTEHLVGNSTSVLGEELLLLFPVINLMSWPCKCIKAASGDLIVMLEKIIGKLMIASRSSIALKEEFPSISRPGKIVYRLLQHLWFQDHFPSSRFFVDTFSLMEPTVYGDRGPWAPKLREYTLWIVQRRKSSLPLTRAQDIFVTEISFLVCSIAGLLVVHPSLGTSAVDVLSSLGTMNPKVGVALLLVTLFFSNISTCKEGVSGDIMLNVLRMLPSLASHSSMVPLVIQTILPLLRKGGNSILFATAARLLCHTWEINDRAFGSLQEVLLPSCFAEFTVDRNVCLGMAASVRDICRKNPDRGVDLILSISVCIESRDPLIQALGLQSLAHLCEADVVDFYTAWDVIEKHVLDYFNDPILAHSICLLLRWGAMDAEAYPEASRNVLQILWGIGASAHPQGMSKWSKARASAFDALYHYEISYIEKIILEFKERVTMLLFSETDDTVLCSMELFQIKIITHEHMNRQRFKKEKRVASNKIEKMLDVFPHVVISSGKGAHAMELPWAALLCLSFSPKLVKSKQTSVDVDAEYENAFVDIATSLQLSRNSFLALLSLQSWKSFMQGWIRAKTLSSGNKGSSSVSDRTSKAASNILERITTIAENSFPRSSENIALAIGALCVVLPPSAHSVKSTASAFLLKWLSQFEHEHRQWSAALSLGLITGCLHVTDHKQKFQNGMKLIEVLCGCKSTLVRGACGIGLGFVCQDLLTWGEAADNLSFDREAFKIQGTKLLGKIVRSLSTIICQYTESSHETLHSLSDYFSMHVDAIDTNVDLELLNKHDLLEEDVWGLAGLVLGLGSSICAAYRAGEVDVVLKIKDLIVSWVPQVNPSVQSLGFSTERPEMLLSVGACLVLPFILAFCHRVELIDDRGLHHLLHDYRELISVLVSVKKPGVFHESFLMASCASAGTLLDHIMNNEVVHSIEVELVVGLLELFRKCYSISNPPVVHFGGMLGVVSSLGADLGILFHTHPVTSVGHRGGRRKQESSPVMGPLHSSPVCEVSLTSMVQDLFLIAQNPEDPQLQNCATWALSLLQQSLWSKEVLNIEVDHQKDNSSSFAASQAFSDDTVVMKLCFWLMNVNHPMAVPEVGSCVNVRTLGSVMKCLSQAPRLPNLDWGPIIRRCMRYGAEAKNHLPSLASESGALREQCILFAIAHAAHFDQLVTLLDELSDLSRFRTLEPSLKSCLLIHLADLVKVFSGSRIKKLLKDIDDFFSTFAKHEDHINQQQSLRISCWKGIFQCLQESFMDFLAYESCIKGCMEVLVSLLPYFESEVITEIDWASSENEWSEALRCLAKTPLDWLLKFLQVDSVPRDIQITEFLKKVELKVRLVREGSVQLTELVRVKAILLNLQSDVIWNVLIQVVAALQHAEGSVKRQWLVDAVEISCISNYPTTAMLFVGLLSGSFSKYMPLLILDKVSVLSDLPLTLACLLLDPTWEAIAERLTSALWSSMERIHGWVTCTYLGGEGPGEPEIDPSESRSALSLLHIMHTACFYLKKYLPLEKQIRLADMEITSSP